jgi:hypothetical protein
VKKRGLGAWLKLKARANSLPLLEMLARYSRMELDASDLKCRLCDGEQEDLSHFLCKCPALQQERASFTVALESDEDLLAGGELALSMINQWRYGTPTERTKLVLQTVEMPVDRAAREERKRTSGARDSLIERVECLFLPFIAAIWRKRAELLGGVPMLDRTGSKLVLSSLREDGRTRCVFVAGASALTSGDT